MFDIGFLIGQHIGPWSMPSVFATACAVTRLSPVIITIVTPASCSERIASDVLALMGSATPRRPPRSAFGIAGPGTSSSDARHGIVWSMDIPAIGIVWPVIGCDIRMFHMRGPPPVGNPKRK